jgi:hypothetical protein
MEGGMLLIGLMPVRNEDWVIGLSARVALLWCDALVVADHGSTDRSREILEALADEYGRDSVIIRDDRESEWREMEQRQMLLGTAREHGATHIAIIDADEVLTGNLLPSKSALNTIDTYLDLLSPGEMLQMPLCNLRGGIGHYHQNGIWGNRITTIAFSDTARLAQWIGDNFHAREPRGLNPIPYKPTVEGGVMHLWGASERRLRAKSAWYKLTERLRWPDKLVAQIDKMYSWAICGEPGHPSYGTPETWRYADVPAAWWAPYQSWLKYLDVDAEPWQEAECARIVRDNPGIERGLDLFGVI